MKRRLGALMLAAAMGGCMSTNQGPPSAVAPTIRAYGPFQGPPSVPGLTGAWGEPVQMAAPYSAQSSAGWMTARQANYIMGQSVPLSSVYTDPNVVQAGAQMPGGMAPGNMISPPGMPYGPGMPPGMMMPPQGMPLSDGSNNAILPRPGVTMFPGMTQAAPPAANLPVPPGMMPPPPGSVQFSPNGPFPGGRPPGAVAAIGALTGNGPGPAPYTIGRTQIRFTAPSGMKVAWLTQGPDGKAGYSAPMVEVPGRYNFLQASIYSLKLSSIEKRPGLEVYPTLEVVPCNHKTEAFLSHSAVPLTFTDQDFQEVAEGKYLVKVIYLPDPQYQEYAAAGIETLVSTTLEPGADPILEAQRRGSILAVVRMGNVDQEAPNTPPLSNRTVQNPMQGMMMPPPGMMPPGMMPPGMMAMPGMMPPGAAGAVPVPGNVNAGPSIPPYLRSNPGSAVPVAPPPSSSAPGFAPMPSSPVAPPSPPNPLGPTGAVPAMPPASNVASPPGMPGEAGMHY